jgi:hypothetical protein
MGVRYILEQALVVEADNDCYFTRITSPPGFMIGPPSESSQVPPPTATFWVSSGLVENGVVVVVLPAEVSPTKGNRKSPRVTLRSMVKCQRHLKERYNDTQITSSTPRMLHLLRANQARACYCDTSLTYQYGLVNSCLTISVHGQ